MACIHFGSTYNKLGRHAEGRRGRSLTLTQKGVQRSVHFLFFPSCGCGHSVEITH